MSTLIASYVQQSFNDALNYLEKAKSIDKNARPFDYWKFCTLSIILSCVCMESYIISHIRVIRDEMDPQIWSIYENGRPVGFYSKVKFIQFICDSVIIDDADSNWINISDSIKIRNDLIHFNQENIFQLITTTNAEKSIKACRDFIKKVNNAIGLDNSQHANWIDKQTSEDYN